MVASRTTPATQPGMQIEIPLPYTANSPLVKPPVPIEEQGASLSLLPSPRLYVPALPPVVGL
eukprot:9569338-Alexandrium_andersonii.AAC.1